MTKIPRRKKATSSKATTKSKAKGRSKATSKPKTKSKNGARGPTGRPQGKTTGLGVQKAWIHIFQQNEKAGKAKRMTDDQISAWMKKEFKGRESGVFDGVQGCRTKYNKGGFTGKEAPKLQSKRYGSGGEVLPPRVGRPAAPGTKKKTGGKKSPSKRGKRA